MKLNCAILLSLVAGLLPIGYGHADDSLPGQGYAASRYETLWTKSPFSVATPDASDQPSEFSLVGIANLDGVDYASLVNKQTNERYLLTSGKPQKGLSLVSITRGGGGDKTFAVVQNNGQMLTLKLSNSPASVAGGNMPQVANGGMPMPGQPGFLPQWPNRGMYPQMGGGFPSTMPQQASNAGFSRIPGQPPIPIIRHPIIRVPIPPTQ